MMLRKLLSQAVLVASLSTLVSCTSTSQVPLSNSAKSNGEAIVLTDVDFDPASLIPETQPLADYLAAHLGNVGITKGEVQIAPDSKTVEEWMVSGKVNLYADSVYPVMQVMEKTSAKPILRRWKNGVAEYKTVFIARRDSGLTRLADLQGKMIALEDPASSSGFMFPIVHMLKAKMNPVEKTESNHPVASNEVGYVFSGRAENTAKWVLNGKVVAGALDNESFSEIPEDERKQLVVLAETDFFPRHIVLVGPGLTLEQVAAVRTTLLNMDSSSEGQAVLKEFGKTTKFDQFPEGAEATIARLQGAYKLLQNHLKEQQAKQ